MRNKYSAQEQLERSIVAACKRFTAQLRSDICKSKEYLLARDQFSNQIQHTHGDIDASWLQQLRKKEDDSWNRLVGEWSPKLYSFLHYSLPTPEDAEDALSEVFVSALRGIDGFDGKSKFSTWLFSIAHHKVADYYRRNRVTEELTEDLEHNPSHDYLDLRDALKAMPDHLRQALLLRYREGYGVDEIAKIMGRSYKATESLLSRARTILKQSLKDEDWN
jgi:RNA polymerase sigma-70 factor (ECF subfamily)